MAKRVCDPTSGKIGSEVYMIGRNGQVVRRRVIPANPSTSFQKAVRAAFTTASRAYDALTQAQQNAWIVAAAGYKTKTRLGMNGAMTGNQFFVQVNANLLESGEEMVSVPPSVPQFDQTVATGFVIAGSTGARTLTIATSATMSNDTRLLAAKPVKSGVHRIPEMVDLGVCPATSSSTSVITTIYAARFGAPPDGSKVFIGLKQTNAGFDGPLTIFSALVPTT